MYCPHIRNRMSYCLNNGSYRGKIKGHELKLDLE